MSTTARMLENELPPKRGERLISHQEAVRVTHLDAQALAIVEESDMSTYNRQGHHRGVRTSNLLNDFFQAADFEGKTIADLGPGHYTLALLARHFGARVVCVERHPLHAALGRHLGFEVLEMDFEDLSSSAFGGPLDGIWMKAASNACAYKDERRVAHLPETFTQLLAPGGWGWVAPRNLAGRLEGAAKQKFEEHRIALQRSAFESRGWSAVSIDEADLKRYALNFAGARYLFIKGLALAAGLAS